MDHNVIDKLTMTLIHRAEDECAERDPDMVSSAAMVLVGDVYALHVCQDGDATKMRAPVSGKHEDDGLSPFIR